MQFLPSLLSRNRQPEVMDQPGLDEAAHIRALQALQRINFLSASAGMLWQPIRQLTLAAHRPIAVLDVACGGGDLPIQLWHRARRQGVTLTLAGCDVSERAIQYARRQASAQQATVHFFPLDALAAALPAGYDVVTCSLFMHHLADDDAIELMRKMSLAAERLVLVNDLERSRANWLLAWLVTRTLTGSWVARIDGPLSVQAAFTAAELRQLAIRAGLIDAQVTRRWPWRLLLAWEKSPSLESTP